VLCFDEIITGFRVGFNGAQSVTGVTPDLCTLGKGIAGGIPFSSVAGKAKIMDLCTDRSVVGAGTFSGYPLFVAASLATLKYIEKDDGVFFKKMDKVQRRLMAGMKKIAQRNSTPVCVQGLMNLIFYQFLDKEVVYNVEEWMPYYDAVKQEKFRQLLFDNGVLIIFRGRWYFSGRTRNLQLPVFYLLVEQAFQLAWIRNSEQTKSLLYITF